MARRDAIVSLSAAFGLRRDGPEKPYMNRNETALFDIYRRSGQYSLFRVQKCGRTACGKDIPKAKQYCSKECWAEAQVPDDVLRERVRALTQPGYDPDAPDIEEAPAEEPTGEETES